VGWPHRSQLSPLPLRAHVPWALRKDPLWNRVTKLYRRVSPATPTHRPARLPRVEYWAMLFACMLNSPPRAVFCDSTAYDRPKRWLRSWPSGSSSSAAMAISPMASAAGVFDRTQRPLRSHLRPLPGGGPAHEFTFEAARSERIKKAASTAAPRFLYVGRLAQEKGWRSC